MDEFDHAKATGNILFWDLGKYYRLTSKIFNFVEKLDYENGLDIFVPADATDAELGAAIRSCHAASKRVNVKDFPRSEGAAKDRATHKAWEKLAFDKLGIKRMSDVGSVFSAVTSKSDSGQFLFENHAETKDGDFVQLLQGSPSFRRFLVRRDCSDSELGDVARKALASVVRLAK